MTKFYGSQEVAVKVWRPTPLEQRPPINPWAKPEDCAECKREQARKEPLENHHGNTKEWIDLLSSSTTFKQASDWWLQVTCIKWKPEDEMALRMSYFRTATKLATKEYWGDYKCPYALFRTGGMRGNPLRPADEEWFRNYGRRVKAIAGEG